MGRAVLHSRSAGTPEAAVRCAGERTKHLQVLSEPSRAGGETYSHGRNLINCNSWGIKLVIVIVM